MALSWTQPCCYACWIDMYPNREPATIVGDYREDEICCYCGGRTRDGIYVRVDPTTVAHATLTKEDT